LKQPFAFPAKTQAALYVSPHLTVALVLALGASLLQLVIALRKDRIKKLLASYRPSAYRQTAHA
jgi:hypothetical protein